MNVPPIRSIGSCAAAFTLLVSALQMSGCQSDPQGCSSDQNCRYNRVCHPEWRICVWPSDTIPSWPSDAEDSTGTTKLPDGDAAAILFQDDFEDRDLDEWDEEYSTRSANYRNGNVVFQGSEGGGRHDSHAEWTTEVGIESLRGIRLQSRFKMGLDTKDRDQLIEVRVRLWSSETSSATELGLVSFYTRWEGRSGTLADKCRADQGRGWCTYWASDPAIRGMKTEYFADVGARNQWKRVDASLESIVENDLEGVEASRVEALELAIRSRGAWGMDSRGLFDYVRLVR